MKVLVGTGGDGLMEALRAGFPEVEFVSAGSPEETVERIRDADVYYGSAPSSEAFAAAERLRWMQHIGTGVDWLLDLPELVESDVVLTNCRGPHADPMADHVIGMMVSLAHRLWEMRDDQRAHRWMPRKYDGNFVEMARTTMGILGFGDIGMAIARRALGFEMKVYAVDKHPRTPPPGVEEVWGLDKLDEMLSISDWFVVTAPFTAETQGLIDAGRLTALKRGAHVIAISRGGIIDEDALIGSLRSGHVSGAGLDVTAVEPLPDDSPLWDMENVVISPHASALTPEMWEGRQEIFKENLRRFLADEPFLYVCHSATSGPGSR